MVFPRWRVVIFVNGCFWHRHGCKRTTVPKTHTKFWEEKFGQNIARDIRNYASLQSAGWHVVILWTCEFRDVDEARALIIARFPSDAHRAARLLSLGITQGT